MRTFQTALHGPDTVEEGVGGDRDRWKDRVCTVEHMYNTAKGVGKIKEIGTWMTRQIKKKLGDKKIKTTEEERRCG